MDMTTIKKEKREQELLLRTKLSLGIIKKIEATHPDLTLDELLRAVGCGEYSAPNVIIKDNRRYGLNHMWVNGNLLSRIIHIKVYRNNDDGEAVEDGNFELKIKNNCKYAMSTYVPTAIFELDNNQMIWTNRVSSGYGGEGPGLLFKILQTAGIPLKLCELVYTVDGFELKKENGIWEVV